MRTNPKWLSVIALGAFTGCGDSPKLGEDVDLGETSQAMKYDFWLTDPSAAIVTGNPLMAGVTLAGTVPANTFPNTDANRCNQCTFTSHRLTNATAHVALDTQLTNYADNHLWNHGGTSSIRSKFKAAQAKAQEPFNATYASKLSETINDFKALLKQWPGVTDSNFTETRTPNTVSWFRGFKPTHTRMLAIDNGFVWHPQPYALEELRYRGARTYCAMHEAARQNGNQHRSQGSSASVSFLEWQLGQADSTVAFGQPWKDVSSKTANVFVVPILVGSRIAPIAGPLVPTPGHIVNPISMITADSVIVSSEDNGQDAWVTSQHADGFLGRHVKAGLKAQNLPLFTTGFVTVTAGFDFDAEYGKLLDITQEGGQWMGTAAFDPPNPTEPGQKFKSDLTAGRVFAFTPPGYKPRTHLLDKWDGSHYRPDIASDAPIADDPRMTLYEDDGVLNSFKFPEAPGYYTRVKADDDRAITVGDRVRENLSVTYAGGFEFQTPVISIIATVSGTTSLDMTVQRMTTIREQMSAVPGDRLKPQQQNFGPPGSGFVNWTGQSNVVVVPETKKDFNLHPLEARVRITFDAEFWPFSVHEEFDQVLFSVGSVNLGDEQKKIGEEANRLRVGSFTEAGLEYFANPAQDARHTWSHLPGNVDGFPSFPNSGAPDSVGACINAVPQTLPVPPAPIKGTKGTPVQSQLCVYGISCPTSIADEGACASDYWGLPSNICTPGAINTYLDVNGWPAGTDLRGCMSAVLTHLCSSSVSPPPKVQNWAGLQNVIARSVDTNQIGRIQEQCVDAFAPYITTQALADAYGEIIANFFHYALCDSSWNIKGDQKI